MAAKRLIKSLLAVSAFGLWVGHADATVYTLGLTGDVSQLFVNPDSTFFGQPLMGLDPAHTLTVVNGDQLNVTITLNGSITIPAGSAVPGAFTDFELFLFSSNFPAGNAFTDGTATFFNGGVQTATTGGTSETSTALAAGGPFHSPNNPGFTFDSITENFTITQLGGPAVLNNAAIDIQLITPAAAVPEPTAWALMLVGFGGVGALLRRRRALAAAI